MGDLPLHSAPAPSVAARCPYCHEAIPLEGRVWIACEDCLARHHRSCWKTNTGCGCCPSKRGLSPRTERAFEGIRRGSKRRSRWELLLFAVLGALTLIITGTIAHQAGRRSEARRQQDPRVLMAEARAEQQLAVRVCRQTLRDLGRDDLAGLIATFHTSTSQRHRLAVMDRLAKFLKAPPRDTPPEAVAILNAYLPRAMMDISAD